MCLGLSNFMDTNGSKAVKELEKESDGKSTETLALVKKGKDCIAIAETISSDITKGNVEGVEQKLKGLERDAEELSKHAEERAKEAKKVEEQYKQETEEIQRKIGELELQESELKQRKVGLEASLSSKQSLLSQVNSELSSAESRLRDAEYELEKAKRQQTKRVGGGATLGAIFGTLIFPGVGTALGAAAGAGTGLAINDSEVKEARYRVDNCRSKCSNTQSEVDSARREVSKVESEIYALRSQCQELERKRKSFRENVGKMKKWITFYSKAAHFWEEFKGISEHGLECTTKLQVIISKAKEEDLDWLSSSTAGEKIAKPFLDAWEEIETKWEQSSKFKFKIEQ